MKETILISSLSGFGLKTKINVINPKDFIYSLLHLPLSPVYYEPIKWSSPAPSWLGSSIDLIHDTRHLFTRLRNDGMKPGNVASSGGKQMKEFANTSNRGRVCLFYRKETTILVLQFVQFEFRQVLHHYCLKWGNLRPLLHPGKKQWSLPLISVFKGRKFFAFRLSRIKETWPRFLVQYFKIAVILCFSLSFQWTVVSSPRKQT